MAVENYLYMFHELYGMQYVILRASNPYGERQGHAGVQGVIGTFMRKIIADEPIEIWGDGKVVRDFIYVSDLTKLCVLAGQSNLTGIYNAGSGVGHSINEIVNFLNEATGRQIEPAYLGGRSFDVSTVVLDISHTTSEFAWAPLTSLADGIRNTWKNQGK